MKGYWTTKNGEEIKISDMEISHIKNCIKMLERDAIEGVEAITSYGYCENDNYISGDVDILYGEEFLNTTPYKLLKEELTKRVNQ